MEQERPFFKGLPGISREAESLDGLAARDSIYYWWWAFLRLNPKLWLAWEQPALMQDSSARSMVQLVGDLRYNTFGKWWKTKGAALFVEARRPLRVRMLNLDSGDPIALYSKSVVVEIPLTIRKQTILRGVKAILEQQGVHDGRGLDLAKTSTATLKLFTLRYRMRSIEASYWVLLYRLLYPDIATWRIGDRLRLAPGLIVRDLNRDGWSGDQKTTPFDRLHSLTGRHLYKSRRMLANVECGRFPDAQTKISIDPAKALPLMQADRWLSWLREEFALELEQNVIRRNRLDRQVALPDSQTRRLLPAFIAGESDNI